MPNSNNLESSPQTASDSLLVRRGNLLKLVEVFKGPLWEGLLVMLQAEQAAHSRASVYSDTEVARHEHNGIVKWLDEVLAGVLETNYRGQIDEELGSDKPSPEDPGGTPWMEADGLNDQGA